MREGSRIPAAAMVLVRLRASFIILFLFISKLHLYIQGLGCQIFGSLLPDMCRQALCGYIMQLLVVNEYFGRQAFQNPLVSNGLVW